LITTVVFAPVLFAGKATPTHNAATAIGRWTVATTKWVLLYVLLLLALCVIVEHAWPSLKGDRQAILSVGSIMSSGLATLALAFGLSKRISG
jgi:hypothetical protein